MANPLGHLPSVNSEYRGRGSLIRRSEANVILHRERTRGFVCSSPGLALSHRFHLCDLKSPTLSVTPLPGLPTCLGGSLEPSIGRLKTTQPPRRLAGRPNRPAFFVNSSPSVGTRPGGGQVRWVIDGYFIAHSTEYRPLDDFCSCFHATFCLLSAYPYYV